VEVDGIAQTFAQTAAASLPDVSESTIVIEPGFFANVEENIVTEVVDEGPANVEEHAAMDSAGVNHPDHDDHARDRGPGAAGGGHAVWLWLRW
jgi:hypothetical protein